MFSIWTICLIISLLYILYATYKENIQSRIDNMEDAEFPVDREVSHDEFYGIPNTGKITFVEDTWDKEAHSKTVESWKK